MRTCGDLDHEDRRLVGKLHCRLGGGVAERRPLDLARRVRRAERHRLHKGMQSGPPKRAFEQYHRTEAAPARAGPFALTKALLPALCAHCAPSIYNFGLSPNWARLPRRSGESSQRRSSSAGAAPSPRVARVAVDILEVATTR